MATREGEAALNAITGRTTPTEGRGSRARRELTEASQAPALRFAFLVPQVQAYLMSGRREVNIDEYGEG